MLMLRRILILAAISSGGLALLAPLAARSATPIPAYIADGLLPAADAPQVTADRGGLSGRQGSNAVSTPSSQAPE